jgi:ATP-dependent DNA helicase
MPLAATGKRASMAEMARSLLELESEKIEVVPDTAAGRKDVLSDTALAALLDRSPEVFVRRGAGWKEADLRRDADGEKRRARARVGTEEVGAFEVYDAPVDEGNDALGRIFSEDGEEPAE